MSPEDLKLLQDLKEAMEKEDADIAAATERAQKRVAEENAKEQG